MNNWQVKIKNGLGKDISPGQYMTVPTRWKVQEYAVEASA